MDIVTANLTQMDIARHGFDAFLNASATLNRYTVSFYLPIGHEGRIIDYSLITVHSPKEARQQLGY